MYILVSCDKMGTIMEQDSPLSQFRDERTSKDFTWTSSIEDRAKEADRIKAVFGASPSKSKAVRNVPKKSFIAKLFG